ncbi:MAG: hypothetical protein NC095_06585 [Muribaculum sp.]|nr:hypothetical protein [Muribaculum sp.]
MKATNVEELIYALESFDTDEEIIMGVRNGKGYLFVGKLQVPIQLTIFDLD